MLNRLVMRRSTSTSRMLIIEVALFANIGLPVVRLL